MNFLKSIVSFFGKSNSAAVPQPRAVQEFNADGKDLVSEWYVLPKGKRKIGPLSRQELREQFKETNAEQELKIRRGEKDSWVPACRVKDVYPELSYFVVVPKQRSEPIRHVSVIAPMQANGAPGVSPSLVAISNRRTATALSAIAIAQRSMALQELREQNDQLRDISENLHDIGGRFDGLT
jgi:hypothetical protein